MQHIVRAGTLGPQHHKGHVPLRFDVPAGVASMRIFLTSHPARATGAPFDNLLCLSLFGPDGPRGTRHNNPSKALSLDAFRATPGFTPGPIEPGEWTVVLDAFRIIGPDPLDYRVEIMLSSEPVEPLAPRPLPALVDPGPGWYRGDLHAHSLHSDGRWDIPDLVASAKRRGLDFVTLTDHNTVSGLAQMDRLADAGILTMGGVELTTHYGHALALGTRQWQEWRAGSLAGVTMPGIAARVAAEGALFVIAHPMSPGDPACAGRRWEYADMRPGNAPAVEIWNGVWADYNEEGVAEYFAWLNEAWLGRGERLVATAGTDSHGPFDGRGRPGFNHVLAQGRTERAILEAVAQGRNYLSSGPRLVIGAETTDRRKISMGGRASKGVAIVEVNWRNAGDARQLRLIGNGREAARQSIDAEGSATFPARAGAKAWYLAELRDAKGELHAITNPIFVG